MGEVKSIGLIKPPIFSHSGVKAFFSTNSFNHSVESIAGFVNVSRHSVYFPVQKHTDKIHILESDLKPVIADAVVTDRKGLLIGVQTADCVPVLLLDNKRVVIGAVHAGWRGTAKQILKKTIKIMLDEFHSSKKDILIATGPSIRKCCYCVKDDVHEAVSRATGKGNYCYKKKDKYFIDLASANMIQALAMGILQKNIWQSDECTSCNPDRFYSYRYSKGRTGRQGGFIGIF